MTNYEKVIKNMDSHSLADILCKSKACPFPNGCCGTCEFYGHYSINDIKAPLCNFPKDMVSILEWLESKVE